MVKFREIHSYSNVKQGALGPRLYCWYNPKHLPKARSSLAVGVCQATLGGAGGSAHNKLHQEHFCAGWDWQSALVDCKCLNAAPQSGHFAGAQGWDPGEPPFVPRWVLYEEPNYRGRMYVVERGEFSSFNEWQARSASVQSIRRVVNYF